MAAVPTIDRADGLAAATTADAAAELLFERFHERIYGYCLYQLGTREEAEDAAQVAFVQALRGLRRGVVPRVEAAWIFAIAKNVCLERRQARGRRRDREVLQDPATLEWAASGAEAADIDVARLREALDRIPKHQREAVLLREWRGLSYREIAAEMSLSLAAVETLIFRARRSLANELADERETTGGRLARGITLGPLAAALKSALAGSAAKVALTAAVLAVSATLTSGVLVGAAASPEADRRPTALPPDDVPAVPEPTFQRPAAAAPAVGAKRLSTRKGTSMQVTSNQKATENGDAASVGGDKKADDLLQPAEDAVAKTGDVLDPIVEPVKPVIEPLQETVESALQAAPQTPDVQLDTLTGELDTVTGELQLP